MLEEEGLCESSEVLPAGFRRWRAFRQMVFCFLAVAVCRKAVVFRKDGRGENGLLERFLLRRFVLLVFRFQQLDAILAAIALVDLGLPWLGLGSQLAAGNFALFLHAAAICLAKQSRLDPLPLAVVFTYDQSAAAAEQQEGQKEV